MDNNKYKDYLLEELNNYDVSTSTSDDNIINVEIKGKNGNNIYVTISDEVDVVFDNLPKEFDDIYENKYLEALEYIRALLNNKAGIVTVKSDDEWLGSSPLDEYKEYTADEALVFANDFKKFLYGEKLDKINEKGVTVTIIYWNKDTQTFNL